MRIGIEAQRLFRKNKHGMDIVALELIKGLRKIDHQNEYFLFVKEDDDQKLFVEQENFHTVVLKKSPYPIWEQSLLPNAVKKYNLDLLHCTANTAPLNCDVPVVLTLHDVIFLESINLSKGTWYQRFGNLYRRWNVPRIINTVAKITTVSNYEKENIINYFKLDPNRIQTIHNAVGNHFKVINDNTVLEPIRKRYQLPEKFLFAFINKDPRKNTVNILKAYSKLIKSGYDIPLFVSDTHPGYVNTILNEIGHPELNDKIISTGYLSNHDLPYIYNLASAFIFPSTRESFGIPVLEAMACGTPVVTSNISSMPEIAGDAGILVDPFDSNAIAQGLKKLLDDEDFYEAYRQKSIKQAEKFRWEETARKCIEIYKEVLKNN